MQEINELRSRDLEVLLNESWSIRAKNAQATLVVSAPSAKTYVSDHHRNKRNSFVNISLTGRDCTLNCEHCNARLLENMVPVNSGEELESLADRLVDMGCEGVLLSGGATETGEVPLGEYIDSIPYLKKKGLKVLVHSGLATRETASELKRTGVDQVLLDIIGDKETVKEVYHLDKSPSDFLKSLKILIDEGLDAVPHIVIGLHFGKVLGEYHALEIVTQAKTRNIVLVVLSPVIGSPMEEVTPPSATEIGKITAIARILNPNANITLGCARPPGTEKVQTEKYAVRAGINGIAYPTDETIKYAQGLGLDIVFRDTCCSLL
jgi:uncharacterized radical SAM superfamily protein